jgi:hypothetical protein
LIGVAALDAHSRGVAHSVSLLGVGEIK